MAQIKLLNHWLCQAIHYFLENGEFCPVHRMYKDKLSGAITMIEQLECDAELKQHAAEIDDFISKIKYKPKAEIKNRLAKTRE